VYVTKNLKFSIYYREYKKKSRDMKGCQRKPGIVKENIICPIFAQYLSDIWPIFALYLRYFKDFEGKLGMSIMPNICSIYVSALVHVVIR